MAADGAVAAPGRVWLVGAGPGAADLLTLRAMRALQNADVVLHDALVTEDVLALAPNARHIAVGKRAHRPSTAQRFINRQLIDCARRYARVVRLKGGDPMLFGRAEEEMTALAEAGIPFEVVPGVTAAFAAASELQVSLTRRGLSRSVAFVTPRVGVDEAEADWLPVALHADTVVLYMAGRQVGRISAELIAAGKRAVMPIALVESASLPESTVRFATLATAGEAAAELGDGPAILLIGDVLADRSRDAVAMLLEQRVAA